MRVCGRVPQVYEQLLRHDPGDGFADNGAMRASVGEITESRMADHDDCRTISVSPRGQTKETNLGLGITGAIDDKVQYVRS